MKRTIRIGTRDSELALWQAKSVKKALEALGYETELVPVKSQGDVILDKPLYEFGITGIFTKTLDVAMLKDTIDIAVHSMKDVPTSLPKGITEGAIFKRADTRDILLHKGLDFLERSGCIATGSLRRKAQWLHKYPRHQVTDLRGNVNTRLQKLKDSDWDGAIFAAAGLDRIDLKPESYINLDWMVPAPAQGAMLVVVKEEDEYCRKALSSLNHRESELCVHIEREFLRTLEGGCTAPIGALAQIEGDQINFHGVLFSLDGTQRFEVQRKTTIAEKNSFGKKCAEEILGRGGAKLMQEIKASVENL